MLNRLCDQKARFDQLKIQLVVFYHCYVLIIFHYIADDIRSVFYKRNLNKTTHYPSGGYHEVQTLFQIIKTIKRYFFLFYQEQFR